MLPSIIVLPLAILFSYVTYQWFLHPLSKIPGPFWAKFSSLWMAKHSWDGDMHRATIALHQEYGKLVRIGPNEVSVSDPNAIKEMYVGAGTKFRKSDWYSVWQGRRKFDLFAERDEGIHGSQRRLIASAYSMTSLKDLERYVDSGIQCFEQRMNEREGTVIDLGNWVQLYAFDIIGEVTFSKRFGFMDVGADDGSFGQIEGALRSAAWIGQVPWLYWLHDYLSPIIGNHLGITARHGSLRTFAAREVAARKDRGSDHKDILSKLFAVQKGKPDAFDDASLISMATSNIFAGSDTTAISIRAILYHLLKNPECLQKLLEEIDERFAQSRLSHPVSLAEADSMPYLQAVMYEALRLHPAVGMSLPRVAPRGGIDVDGMHLPEGTVVGVNPWVIHRQKEVFGDDVESFRPGRWLRDDKKGDMLRCFAAFGWGARLCTGKNISWMEMSKLIPTLFLLYDIRLADPEATLSETCWWFVIQKGLHAVMRRRRDVHSAV
ncbi:cytochrome P450 [Aulographum hederae CBS 113979]|uniref:Cytochrome P450 n=1 Tax=Aulographum hederae CBS 113979 TaxID=1176131 RepID=A0A6G1H7X0_9PEZI|nr:cytochrome P450 [Aulographum hederae CBS 113979]